MINDDMTEYLKSLLPLLGDELTMMKDLIKTFENGPVIESERRLCNGLSQDVRDRFLILGLRCHIWMEHIDDLNLDGMKGGEE